MKFLFGVIADDLSGSDVDESYDVKGLRHTFVCHEGFPTDYTRIFLHFCFRLDVADEFQEVDLAVKFVNEEKGDTLRINMPFKIEAEFMPIKAITTAHFPVSMVFPNEGRYRFDVYIGEEKVGAVNFEAIAPRQL